MGKDGSSASVAVASENRKVNFQGLDQGTTEAVRRPSVGNA